MMRRFDTVFRDIQVFETTLNFPSIASNRSEFIDVATAVGAAPLGTEIISFAPITTATTLDDLIVQIMVVDTDLVRITMMNPTAGAIDPDAIDFRIVTGIANADLSVVI